MVSDWLSQLRRDRLIAVLRAPSLAQGERMAAAVAQAGIRHLEVTSDSDRPFELIQRLGQQLPHCAVGIGTVLHWEQLAQARAVGASFGFSPVLDEGLLAQAIAAQFPLVVGGLTPNEIWRAWQLGAPAVKVFPITAVGGASYLHQLRAPLGQIPLIPTGGVGLGNAQALLAAGAWAVCLGGSLFPSNDLAQQNWAAIAHQAQQLVEQVNELPPLPQAPGAGQQHPGPANINLKSR